MESRYCRSNRERPVSLGALVTALLLSLSLWASASAQGVFERPVRIGVILPPAAMEEVPVGEVPATVGQSARLGAQFARDELVHNAALLGIDVDILVEGAEDSEVVQVAERLVDEEGAFGLVGGFGREAAVQLSAFAAERGIPFMNIGWPGDELRNEQCSRYTFHVAPSDAMYLDALTGWFVRAGFRRWAFVYEDSDRGRDLYERTRWALEERHFGGREVARTRVSAQDPDWEAALKRLRSGEPEVVLALLDPRQQLEFLARSSEAGDTWQVTGFPHPETQTRSYYEAWVQSAPNDENLYRGSGWEATIDAYGARELNARFRQEMGTPMDVGSWAAYQGVRILYDSAIAARRLDGQALLEYMSSPAAVYDVWKGIGVSFRPWDHQLRQSLFLVHLARGEGELPQVTLVGELPALYLPRTDPLERLDQLGDLEAQSECDFG
ncbi:MAG TPA: ABC transporter substrate-binding protein [Trueperaceae bacterium]